MRFDKLDLNLLVALDALLTHRHISRAAEQLNLTQSALSAALSRLREYFGDELLVQVARRMELTPRAETLREPVRDILVRIRGVIAARPGFDPVESDRTFTLLASEYSLETLIPTVVARSGAQGGRVSFRVHPLTTPPARALESGDADLLLIPKAFCAATHPTEMLLQEDLVCLVWEGSQHAGRELTLDAYKAARHVVMEPPPGAHARTFDTTLLERAGIDRDVAVTTYSFSSLSSLVIGTEYIATLQRRLAERMVERQPVKIFAPPIELPTMPLMMQWHSYRAGDPSIAWLRSMLKEAAGMTPINTDAEAS